MSQWEIDLNGGCHSVKCTVDVTADTQAEAEQKAIKLAKEYEDWEINPHDISEEDISVRHVRKHPEES